MEAEITEPLESALATVSGVDGVMSQSASNVAMVFLEFEDGTDMDSAMVKVSSAVNQVASQLPETAGTPSIMELSMDMMATSYVAASFEGKDIYELSDFAEDTLMPRLERVNGVADVSVTGTVQRMVEVRLSDSKIEDVNNRLLASVNDELADAKREIEEGEADLDSAEDEIKAQQEKLAATEKETTDQLGQAVSGLTLAVSSSMSKVSTLGVQLQSLQAQGESLGGTVATLQEEVEALPGEIEALGRAAQEAAMAGDGGFESASEKLHAAQHLLADARVLLDEAKMCVEEGVTVSNGITAKRV